MYDSLFFIKYINWPRELFVGADNEFSKNKTDFEFGPNTVIMSELKGLSRQATRCFAAAQHDRVGTDTDARINLFNCIIGGGAR
jgi:hypothetical protein